MGRNKGSKDISRTVKHTIFIEALRVPIRPRRVVAVELRELIKRMGEVVPSEETLEKMISETRNKADSSLDEPWYVVTLAEYDIPPEALPTVLKMAAHFRRSEGGREGRPMTIREAKWAARLSSLEDLHKLFDFILDYAQEEKVVALTGIMDGFSSVIDDKLYMALTDKYPNEPVFDDITGMELPSSAQIKIQKGLDQRRRIKPVSKKKQREAKHERPHSQEG